MSLSFAPDSRTFASGSDDGSVRMWDVASGELKKSFLGNQQNWVRCVSFSPDGRTLAAGRGGAVWLWYTATGQLKKTLTGHSRIIGGMSFSPDGKTLAVGDVHGVIRLWDTAIGKQNSILFAGDPHNITSLSFSPNGKILASGSWDGTILLWNLPPATNAEATLRINPVIVKSPTVGQKLKVSLEISDGVSVTGFHATVVFDAAALRYIDSRNGDYLPDGSTAASPIVETNSVRVSAKSNIGSRDGDGTLATLIFEVIAVKASTLRLSNVSIINSDGFILTPNVKGGQVGR